MKKQILLAALCSTSLLSGCNEAANQTDAIAADSSRSAVLPAEKSKPEKELDENTLLTVNDQPVTKAMYSLYFQDRMRNVPDAQNNQQMQMTVLNELANVLIVAQDAERNKIDQRPEIAATLALLRAKLLTQTAIQEYAKTHTPSDAEVQSHYDSEYAGQVTTEYKARHILTKQEDEAISLITQLDEGGDFAELAKANSTGPTGKDGGDLGWFGADQMVKPFADEVKTMEIGKYTKEPVKTQFGWHVILLEETRETPPPSFESVKSEITTKLQQKMLADYMKELRANSKLEFNEKAGLKNKPEES